MNIISTQRVASGRSRQAQASLAALIRRSIDLYRLYGHAAQMSEPGLRVVLSENAKTLDLVIGDLQAQLRDCGRKPIAHGSWRGDAHRHLAGWLMHATPRRGVGWIRLLGHRESALLLAFERVIADGTPDAALVLRRQLPRLRGIHLDMDSLAGTTRG